MASELAKVIPLFPGLKDNSKSTPDANCFACVHAAFRNRGGTYCTKFNEEILNEAEASDCESFEADDDY